MFFVNSFGIYPHLVSNHICDIHKIFLFPVGIGPVIVVCRQLIIKVNVFHKGKFFCHIVGKCIVVQSRITVLCSQEHVFVRNNGEVHVHVLLFQKFLIDPCESLGCMIQHLRVQRVFQFRQMTVHLVDVVVVQTAEKMVLRPCFQLAESVTQWELVGGVGFEVCHKLGR